MSYLICKSDSGVALGIFDNATEEEAFAALDANAGYSNDNPNPHGHHDLTVIAIPAALDGIDINLAEDLGQDMEIPGWTRHVFPGPDPDITQIEIVWNASTQRAGYVVTGVGTSGRTTWIDASSPEDALRHFDEDDVID